MTFGVRHLLVAVFFLIAITASADPLYYIGGGPSIPLGPAEFTEAFHGGWNFYLGIGLRYYHFNEIALTFNLDHFRPDDDCVYYDGGKISVSSMALEFRIRGQKDYNKNIRKCLIAGIGISNIDYENRIHRDRSDVFLGLGGGIEFLLTRHHCIWADAKFNIMTNTQGRIPNADNPALEYTHQLFMQIRCGYKINFGRT